MRFWRVNERQGASITEEIDGHSALLLLAQGRRQVSPIARERLRQLQEGAVIEPRYACGYWLMAEREAPT